MRKFKNKEKSKFLLLIFDANLQSLFTLKLNSCREKQNPFNISSSETKRNSKMNLSHTENGIFLHVFREKTEIILMI